MFESELLTYNIDSKIENCKNAKERLIKLLECKEELMQLINKGRLEEPKLVYDENKKAMMVNCFFVIGETHKNKINELLKIIDVKIDKCRIEDENKSTNINEILNKETFKKYKEEFSWGFLPDSFEIDVENIKSIKDKIIFINYIENMLQEYIETLNFVLEMQNAKIDNYYKDKDYYDKIISEEREKKKKEKAERIKIKNIPKEKFKNIKEFVNKFDNITNYEYLLWKKSSQEDRIGFLKDSLFAIQDKQYFWNEQLKVENSNMFEINIINNKDSLKSNTNYKIKEFEKNNNKIKWLGSKEQLEKFFYLLQDYDFIYNQLDLHPNSEIFISNFMDSSNKFYNELENKEIIWRGKESELAYLIGKTRDELHLISGENIWEKTKLIFLKTDKSKFRTLAQSYQKANPKSKDTIQNILNSIKSMTKKV